MRKLTKINEEEHSWQAAFLVINSHKSSLLLALTRQMKWERIWWEIRKLCTFICSQYSGSCGFHQSKDKHAQTCQTLRVIFNPYLRWGEIRSIRLGWSIVSPYMYVYWWWMECQLYSSHQNTKIFYWSSPVPFHFSLKYSAARRKEFSRIMAIGCFLSGEKMKKPFVHSEWRIKSTKFVLRFWLSF